MDAENEDTNNDMSHISKPVNNEFIKKNSVDLMDKIKFAKSDIKKTTNSEKDITIDERETASINAGIHSINKNKIMATCFENWRKLHDWAKTNNCFAKSNILFLDEFATNISENQEFTEEHATWAIRLYDAAVKNGFKPL